MARYAVPRMVAIRLIFNRMYLVFVFALGTIPTRCATVGDLMPVVTIGAIPGVGTERLRIMVVTRAAFAISAVPVAGGTGFVVSVCRCIVGTTPAVRTRLILVITLSEAVGISVAFALAAPPFVRTTVRLRINSRRRLIPETINAEPVMLRTWVTLCRRMMRFFTGGTHPIMHTAFGRIQNPFATLIRTVYVAVRAGIGRRVSHFTTFAIPKMLARLPDVNRRFAGRAVPAMRIRCGTNVICRVVFVFRRTIPVVRAVFVRRENMCSRFA